METETIKWIKWTTLEGKTESARLHNAHWMLEQMEQLLFLQRDERTCIAEEGYLKHPKSGFDRIITMSAWVGFPSTPGGVAGAKWVSSRSQNVMVELPRGRAVTILNCGLTGLPLLAFDGTDLSNARTAMFACAAMARMRQFHKVLLIGAGRVHDWQAYYMKQLWPEVSIDVLDIDHARQAAFCEKRGTFSAHWSNCLRNGEYSYYDVISCATAGAPNGWITDAPMPKLWINTSLRDITPEMILTFDLTIVDDQQLAASQQTPYHQACIKNPHLRWARLCDVTTNSLPQSSHILVNPMGYAVWDVGLGYALLFEQFHEQRRKILYDK